MRLYKYLNEGRSKEIRNERKVKEILEKNCSQAIESFRKGAMILRATDTRGTFLYLDPKKGGERVSYNTSNHYTLWMNHSELWDRFPIRNIICASGHRAIEHGASEVYYAFPFDNTKIGICPTDDIWESFSELKSLNIQTADELNDILYELIGNAPNWEDFKQKLKDTYPENIDEDDLMLFGTSFNLIRDWKEYQDNLYNYLTNLLDPKANNFDLQPISKYSYGWKDNREVWFDNKCILLDRNDKTSDQILDEFGIDYGY